MVREIVLQRLNILKDYVRRMQLVFGIRLYTTECLPKPEVKQISGVITIKEEQKYQEWPWFRPFPRWLIKYVYTINCEDGVTRIYETASGRFEVGDEVIVYVLQNSVQAMKKKEELGVTAILLNIPLFLSRDITYHLS